MHKSRQVICTRAAAAMAFAMLAFTASGAMAQSDEVLTLDIKPQEAGPALMELARVSGTQLMVEKELGSKVRVDGIKGEYRLEEALAALLADTSLTYEFTLDNYVLVQEAEEGAEPEEEVEDDSVVEEEEQPLALGEQTVTGTRLIGGDPSALVYSFTAEEIAARGVSTLEEFFRTLSYTYSNVTTQTGGNSALLAEVADVDIRRLGGHGVGISALNLRGMGVGNSLILLDGQRIAGTGGVEDDFANLLTVPLSAIERVDIQLDGASAVYGADAIGGVVNFISKKDYRGLSATYRHEYSSTDAHSTSADIIGGWAWGSGNVTAILSRSTSKPITNAKTGWSSLDLRPYLGPEFDYRIRNQSQPGVVCLAEKYQPPWARNPTWRCAGFPFSTYYQLPPDHSGANATVDDFIATTGGDVMHPLDELSPQNGAEYTTESVTIRLQQDIGAQLRLLANLDWTVNDSYQEYERDIRTSFHRWLVPASNVFNPFGQTVLVGYAPIHEAKTSGITQRQYDRGRNERRGFGAGLIWNWAENQELTVNFNRAKSWRVTEGFSITPQIGWLHPGAEAFYAALSSSDPDVAINVFGNGTAQGSGFSAAIGVGGRAPAEGVSATAQYSAVLRGRFFNLWGGPISYAIGAEVRENTIYRYALGRSVLDYSVEQVGGPQSLTDGRGTELTRVGVDRPTRTYESYFAEFALPIVGRDNTLPGVRELVLTLQARYDVNESTGARTADITYENTDQRLWYWDPDEVSARSVPYWPGSNTVGLTPDLVTNRRGSVSPRIGLRYRPVEDLVLRVAWRRSFKSPNWSDTFTIYEESEPTPWYRRCFGTYCLTHGMDLFDPDGPTEITPDDGVVQRYVRYTPDLRSEFSINRTFGIEYTPNWLPDLRWRVDFSIVDFTNKVVGATELNANRNPDLLAVPEVGVRNERGDLVEVHHRAINIAESYNEMLTTELEYLFITRYGEFRPRVSYTRWLEHFTQLLPTSEEITRLGEQRGPDKYRLQGSLDWIYGKLTANLFVYYTPSYVNRRAQECYPGLIRRVPEARCDPEDWIGTYVQLQVPSLTTVDLTLTYRMDNGLRLRIGGRNVLNRSAPLTLSGGGAAGRRMPYDPTRWNARGRVLFAELNWEL